LPRNLICIAKPLASADGSKAAQCHVRKSAATDNFRVQRMIMATAAMIIQKVFVILQQPFRAVNDAPVRHPDARKVFRTVRK
jgi:hypothetical protein